MKCGEEKIIEAAHTLFQQRGIRATSIRKVARTCGISVWDVSLKFRSKKELVLAVVRHSVSKKTGYLLISSSLSPSAVTELKTFFKFVEETISSLGPDILLELKRYHTRALDQLQEVVDGTLIPCLERNIQRGLIEGFYREEVDAGSYASTYFFILRTLLEGQLDWIQTKKAITHINGIFLHGILNAKGMRI